MPPSLILIFLTPPGMSKRFKPSDGLTGNETKESRKNRKENEKAGDKQKKQDSQSTTKYKTHFSF